MGGSGVGGTDGQRMEACEWDGWGVSEGHRGA